jgi:hypothetical protein
MDELLDPETHSRIRRERLTLRSTGKIAGAGAGAGAGSLMSDPMLGAVVGAALGDGIEQAVRLVTARVGRGGVPEKAVERFESVLSEYLEESPARVDGVLGLAGDPAQRLDAQRTYAALHRTIAASTQGIRQGVLMRGLAHFATSEQIDVGTFSLAVQTVMGLTRRQICFLAILAGDDDRARISELAGGASGGDPFAAPTPDQHANVSSRHELWQLMNTVLVAQLPEDELLAGRAGAERIERIRQLQPADWSQVDVARLRLSAAGHVMSQSLDLGELSIEIRQELLKELDPIGHQAHEILTEAGRPASHFAQMSSMDDPSSLDGPFDQERDMPDWGR